MAEFRYYERFRPGDIVRLGMLHPDDQFFSAWQDITGAKVEVITCQNPTRSMRSKRHVFLTCKIVEVNNLVRLKLNVKADYKVGDPFTFASIRIDKI